MVPVADRYRSGWQESTTDLRPPTIKTLQQKAVAACLDVSVYLAWYSRRHRSSHSDAIFAEDSATLSVLRMLRSLR